MTARDRDSAQKSVGKVTPLMVSVNHVTTFSVKIHRHFSSFLEKTKITFLNVITNTYAVRCQLRKNQYILFESSFKALTVHWLTAAGCSYTFSHKL